MPTFEPEENEYKIYLNLALNVQILLLSEIPTFARIHTTLKHYVQNDDFNVRFMQRKTNQQK